jgi:hypothetical protein
LQYATRRIGSCGDLSRTATELHKATVLASKEGCGLWGQKPT